MLKENLEAVEAKIQAACHKSGRSRDEVTLIAVSKTKPVETLKGHMIWACVSLEKIKCRNCQTSMMSFPRIFIGI